MADVNTTDHPLGLSFEALFEMHLNVARHRCAVPRPLGGNGLRQRARALSPLSRRWNSSSHQPAQEPIIFSGIQPTGVPHLGNYLGALQPWVKMQQEAKEGTKLFFSIVDLHALTIPQEAAQLRKWRKEAFATLLAVGLDPKRSTIFYQSDVCSIDGPAETNG